MGRELCHQKKVEKPMVFIGFSTFVRGGCRTLFYLSVGSDEIRHGIVHFFDLFSIGGSKYM